jgi:hypothetical protein
MEAMVHCGACGEQIEASARFCEFCGANQQEFQLEAPPAPETAAEAETAPAAEAPAPEEAPASAPAGPPEPPDADDEDGLVVLAVRAVRERPLDAVRHGLLTPVPATKPDSIVLEPRDGSSVRRLYCNAVEFAVAGDKRPLMAAREIRGQLFLTDARLAVACTKYDKGGGWIGGVGALAANAGSKMLAAHRRRGKMLVGHIRYPWLSAVYARNRGGMLGTEQLRLVFRTPGGDDPLVLNFDLPKDTDATAVAAEVVRRAATFRLANDPELSDSEREELKRHQALDRIVWRKGDKNLAGVRFTTWWPVGEHSARFGLPDGVAE